MVKFGYTYFGLIKERLREHFSFERRLYYRINGMKENTRKVRG